MTAVLGLPERYPKTIMSEKHRGYCHICGQFGKLSYEHIPPQSAFNDKRIWVAHGRQLFEGKTTDSLKKQPQQKGAGGHTLCGKCNNDTGGWYARAYADLACQAMEILERAKGAPTLAYPFKIYQLKAIKQIITMFFSVNSPNFRNEVPYLEKFVLDRYTNGLPTNIRVYVGYSVGPNSRSSGKSGILNGGGSSPQGYVVSEIAFPPFVFVLTLDSPCPDPRLLDISFFASSGYDEEKSFCMSLPVLPINTAYPTDYRTQAEVENPRKA